MTVQIIQDDQIKSTKTGLLIRNCNIAQKRRTSRWDDFISDENCLMKELALQFFCDFSTTKIFFQSSAALFLKIAHCSVCTFGAACMCPSFKFLHVLRHVYLHMYTVRIKKVLHFQKHIVLKSINLDIWMWPMSKEQFILFPMVPLLHHVCHA